MRSSKTSLPWINGFSSQAQIELPPLAVLLEYFETWHFGLFIPKVIIRDTPIAHAKPTSDMDHSILSFKGSHQRFIRIPYHQIFSSIFHNQKKVVKNHWHTLMTHPAPLALCYFGVVLQIEVLKLHQALLAKSLLKSWHPNASRHRWCR